MVRRARGASVADLQTVFSTNVISCGGPREALWVLGGLLDNDTVLEPEEHHVDTHGATQALFGMCFLLGFRLQPAFANLHHVTLYKTSRGQNMGEIEPLFSDVINTRLIVSQWDALMRVAASLHHGKTPAHVVMRRLTNSPSRLSKALVELGNLVKTIYVLRYLHEEPLRAAVRRQLNRGELRHALAAHLFIGTHGYFTTGDVRQLLNKATALSVLSNAVVCWNTMRYQEAVNVLQLTQDVDLQKVGYVSPLAYGHVNPQGIYRFADPRMAAQQRSLQPTFF